MLRCATFGSIGLHTYLEWRKSMLAGRLYERQIQLSPRPALRSRNSRERLGSGLVNSYLPLDLEGGIVTADHHAARVFEIEDCSQGDQHG